jgi:hypothetical protein
LVIVLVVVIVLILVLLFVVLVVHVLPASTLGSPSFVVVLRASFADNARRIEILSPTVRHHSADTSQWRS